MKTRNLFLSLFAFAAICACNKEAQPEGPKVPEILDADTYVKVNIMATDASTKADPVYEIGDENDVHNVLFLFYGATNQPVLAEGTIYEWNTNPTGQNVAKSATVKFKSQTEKPTSMIVVLNYDSAKEASYKAANLSSVKDLLAESLYIEAGTPATPHYTMTNSVYVDGSSVICEVLLTDSNFGKTTEEGTTAEAVDPVDVYVERVAAKALLTNNIDPATDVTSSSIKINGSATEYNVTPVVVGYDVVDTPDQSYLFKSVLTSWTYPEWTSTTDHRSFWANTCALTETDYINKTYNEINAVTDPIYLFENTSERHTKVILTAKLTVPDDTFKTDGDTEADVLDLVKYNSTHYTFEGFVNEAKQSVKASKDINIDDKTLVAVPHANGYEMNLKLDAGHGLTTEQETTVNNALALMVASYWAGGKCYYFTEIKHDLKESNAMDAENLVGVVRNHVYKISLNTLKGLGIPVAGDGTSDAIIPSETNPEFYSLNATINILQWKIVEQGVDFNN